MNFKKLLFFLVLFYCIKLEKINAVEETNREFPTYRFCRVSYIEHQSSLSGPPPKPPYKENMQDEGSLRNRSLGNFKLKSKSFLQDNIKTIRPTIKATFCFLREPLYRDILSHIRSFLPEAEQEPFWEVFFRSVKSVEIIQKILDRNLNFNLKLVIYEKKYFDKIAPKLGYVRSLKIDFKCSQGCFETGLDEKSFNLIPTSPYLEILRVNKFSSVIDSNAVSNKFPNLQVRDLSTYSSPIETVSLSPEKLSTYNLPAFSIFHSLKEKVEPYEISLTLKNYSNLKVSVSDFTVVHSEEVPEKNFSDSEIL